MVMLRNRIYRPQFTKPLSGPVLAPVQAASPSTLLMPDAAGVFPRSDEFDIVRRMGFYLALAYVFVRFSLIHEFLTYQLGQRPYIVLLLAPPTILAALLSGGLRRVLVARPARYWCAFVVWIALATPFSFWRGNSFETLIFFLKYSFPLLFIMGGLTLTTRECKLMMYAIAWGAATNIVIGRLFNQRWGDRFALDLAGGSVQNPNDLAAHMLFTIPFVLFAALTGPRVLRLAAIPVMASGLWIILSTGSRAGLLALVVATLFILIRASTTQRVAIVLSIFIIGLVGLKMLPRDLIKRYATIFSNQDGEEVSEAIGSTQRRTDLAKAALRFTIQHPLLGVGPGEFTDYEAEVAKAQKRRPSWQVAHNSYLEVSSEAGVPALVFYLCAIFSAFRLLSRAYKQTRGNPAYHQIASLAFCVMLATVAYCSAIFFCSVSYSYYLPAMSGLAIAFSKAVRTELPLSRAAAATGGAPVPQY